MPGNITLKVVGLFYYPWEDSYVKTDDSYGKCSDARDYKTENAAQEDGGIQAGCRGDSADNTADNTVTCDVGYRGCGCGHATFTGTVVGAACIVCIIGHLQRMRLS
jgi:hypothetical protein